MVPDNGRTSKFAACNSLIDLAVAHGADATVTAAIVPPASQLLGRRLLFQRQHLKDFVVCCGRTLKRSRNLDGAAALRTFALGTSLFRWCSECGSALGAREGDHGQTPDTRRGLVGGTVICGPLGRVVHPDNSFSPDRHCAASEKRFIRPVSSWCHPELFSPSRRDPLARLRGSPGARAMFLPACNENDYTSYRQTKTAVGRLSPWPPCFAVPSKRSQTGTPTCTSSRM